MNFKFIIINTLLKISLCYNTPQFTRNLVIKNYKLVPYFAWPIIKKHNFNQDNINEIMQEGYIGLIYACRKYNSSKGAAISTYSSYWIKRYVNTYINNYYNSPKIISYTNNLQNLNTNKLISIDNNVIHYDELDILNKNERELYFNIVYRKYKPYQLIKIYGVSRTTINNRYNKILNKLKNYNFDSD